MKWHHAINSQILWQGTFFNFVEICGGDNMHIHFFRTICRKYSYGVKICVHIHTFFKNRCLYHQTYILDDVQQIKEHAVKKEKKLLLIFFYKFVLLFPLSKFKLLKHPFQCHHIKVYVITLTFIYFLLP